MFLLFAIIHLNLLKFIFCVENNYNYSVVVTALFYTDQYARMLLVSGPLPKKALQIIEKDLRGMFEANVPIKILPAYKNARLIPVQGQFLNFLKAKYPTMYVSNIPKEDSQGIITDMQNSLNRYVHREKVKARRFLDVDKFLSRSKDANSSRFVSIDVEMKDKRVSVAPFSYLPNDLYYAIEKKCANWAASCSQQAGPFLESPSNYYRPPLQPFPYKINLYP